MSFLNLFSAKQHYLGVDIGTTSIKVVEVLKDPKGGIHMLNYGILEIYRYLKNFSQVLQTSSLKLSVDDATRFLSLLTSKMKIGTKKVIASLPTFSAFTTLIELPVLGEKEIQQAIAYQARQYIPMPISNVTLDWEKVGERKAEDGRVFQQIFLIGVPNDTIDEYKKVFKGAGLDLVSLEIENLSLARFLTYDVNENILILDIGARSTNFSIAKAGVLKFIDQTDFAGASLTQAISSALGISSERAEILKMQRGLSAERGLDIAGVVKPILDVIINEAQRTINNFETNYYEKVGGIILIGSGANLVGILDYFKNYFQVPVRKAYPLEKITYSRDIESIKDGLGIKLAVAAGLALKNI